MMWSLLNLTFPFIEKILSINNNFIWITNKIREMTNLITHFGFLNILNNIFDCFQRSSKNVSRHIDWIEWYCSHSFQVVNDRWICLTVSSPQWSQSFIFFTFPILQQKHWENLITNTFFRKNFIWTGLKFTKVKSISFMRNYGDLIEILMKKWIFQVMSNDPHFSYFAIHQSFH